jgi:formylglycine-generating enzyme
MVVVPGGSYSTTTRRDVVSVGPFCLDRTEVAVDVYSACVNAGKCDEAHVDAWTSNGTSFLPEGNCNYGKAGRDRQPMNCVDWNQAAAFCRAKGTRLPTEEEWEWAARGGARGSRYPWGDAVPEAQVCWSLEGQPRRTATCVVGASVADVSPLGIRDLAGNVHEWTGSTYDPRTRVVRGGTFGDQFEYEGRASTRRGASPVARSVATGFRCAVGRR